MENNNKILDDSGLDELAEDNTIDSNDSSANESKTQSAEGDDALEIAELKDKNLRLYAEFENYRKRTTREKLDLIKTASQDILSSLLPILDDFDRVKKAADENEEKGPFAEGVMLVYQKLYSLLQSKGLEPLQSDLEMYDPELHEAITTLPAPTPELKGKVLDTVTKGYLLNDKLIRHAKVVVGG